MSYRAFKKLLGETSLERKCRFLLGTGSLVLITSSFLFYSLQTERITKQMMSKSGALLIGQILYGLHDEKLEGRDALDQFQKRAEERWPKALKGYRSQVIKPYARSSVNQPDPMMPDETALINEFIQNPGKQEESRFSGSGDNVYYYGAVRAVPRCLNCHYHERTPEERAELGDLTEDSLMAVIRVRLSNQAIEEDFHFNRAIMISVAL